MSKSGNIWWLEDIHIRFPAWAAGDFSLLSRRKLSYAMLVKALRESLQGVGGGCTNPGPHFLLKIICKRFNFAVSGPG